VSALAPFNAIPVSRLMSVHTRRSGGLRFPSRILPMPIHSVIRPSSPKSFQVAAISAGWKGWMEKNGALLKSGRLVNHRKDSLG